MLNVWVTYVCTYVDEHFLSNANTKVWQMGHTQNFDYKNFDEFINGRNIMK